MRKAILIIIPLLLFQLFEAAGQPLTGTVIDEVVAVVGKEYILFSDIEQQYLQMKL